MLQKENINNIKDGNVRKSDIKSIREQHDKKIKSLDSIKQNHSAQVKMIREESKGGKKMGVIEKHVLLDSLKNNVLDITFRKMDGSIRVMKCTLRPDYIPEGNKPDDENTIGRDYSTMDVDTMYQFCGDKPERWAAAMTTNLPPPDENSHDGVVDRMDFACHRVICRREEILRQEPDYQGLGTKWRLAVLLSRPGDKCSTGNPMSEFHEVR